MQERKARAKRAAAAGANSGPDTPLGNYAALNSRPRKTLNWKTPAEALDAVLAAVQDGVATTA